MPLGPAQEQLPILQAYVANLFLRERLVRWMTAWSNRALLNKAAA